uniref:Putative secreted protein n=1 Tax=Anopheles darlingi TaxID=43151 RepID=A0A2M4D6V0_ANODA
MGAVELRPCLVLCSLFAPFGGTLYTKPVVRFSVVHFLWLAAPVAAHSHYLSPSEITHSERCRCIVKAARNRQTISLKSRIELAR